MDLGQYRYLKKNKFHTYEGLLTVVLVVFRSFTFASIPFFANLTATNSQQEIIAPLDTLNFGNSLVEGHKITN